VHRAESALRSISGGGPPNAPARRLGKLRGEFEFATPDEILADGLHEFCDSLQTRLNAVGNDIQRTYFSLDAEPAVERTVEG
jgi:uncharacterized alpha-E superfamily protein